ncbi:phosphate ABC transporter permease subunit PstC [Microbacteriaceae bacterium 4G12]
MAFQMGGSKDFVRKLLKQKHGYRKGSYMMNRIVPAILFLITSVSIVTTIGIMWTLAKETAIFFQRVSLIEFLTAKEWVPFFHIDPKYGILPLLSGTVLVTIIAMVIAVPIGLGCAIFLSEYAPDAVRRVIKPVLEILAGIPTIVYGFFALTVVTPMLKHMIPGLQFFNALSPGIVIGCMMIPTIASLSEDAISAVPFSLREGSFGLGTTRFETTVRAVVPAALSGIMAAIVLAVSRAMGETMIVVIAGGSTPILSFDPTQSIQTLTAYIVQVSLGDAARGTTAYYSMYAVGATLFLFTFIMNLLAQYVSSRFKEVY